MAEPKRHIPVETNVQPAAGGIAARALGARAAPYLADLNPEQREAVETLDGPVLVLAGAGTGKTRVLTTRIAHILNLGRARPGDILAVTFTNKAAREMKLRVGQMVGQVVEGMPWLGTFHSIGVKILRRHAELVGLKIRLHDFGRRRPDPPDQADAGSREARREALAGARLRRHPRRLEEPRLDARPGAGRRSGELCQRQGQEALHRLSGAAEDAQRRRLRRPAAGDASACSGSTRTCCGSTSSASSSSWWTSTRTPTWRSICGCGCWRSRSASPPARLHPLPLRGEGCVRAARGAGEGQAGVRASDASRQRRDPSPALARLRLRSAPSPARGEGKETRARSQAAADARKARKTSAASAMTISRSMAGAGAEVDNILQIRA